MMDLLCFAKPFHHDGWALLSKAFSMMDWLCFAKPIHFDWIALLRKANPFVEDWNGFANASQSHYDFMCPAVFWIFFRGLQFFPGSQMVVADLIACGVHPVSVGGKKRFLQLSKIFVALSSLDWVTRGTPTTSQN